MTDTQQNIIAAILNEATEVQREIESLRHEPGLLRRHEYLNIRREALLDAAHLAGWLPDSHSTTRRIEHLKRYAREKTYEQT